MAGATGLVGRALVAALAADRAAWPEVVALSRRPIAALPPGVALKETDFETLGAADVPAGTTAAFCCLGTTIAKAGSQEAFRHVDHDLVLRFARACHKAGVPAFHVVSALGADAGSRVFYNRVKGETERDVRSVEFPSCTVYRPSLLLGERDESRPAERASILLMRATGPLWAGPLRKWRGIPAERVARAMTACARGAPSGFHVVESGAMWDLAL